MTWARAREAEHVAEEVGRGVVATGSAVARFASQLPTRWQWRAASGAVVLLIVCASALVWWSRPQTPLLGWATPSESLPVALRTAAHCAPTLSGGEQCTVAASDPLLAGRLAGGRDLQFSVRTLGSGELAEELRRWRSTATAVIKDGTVFIAIGPSTRLWFADTQSGVRVETDAFTDQSAARAFVSRGALSR
ncbi:hypothetical protein [Nocardia yamanashiensis]|uniref:hypothetical protein n=1 Tax=Nocardia yamanashiensis TaxID=209247 RepID=UPI00082CFC1A|nr:hypothetical protein [Nocardia yamanashiensis]